MRRQQTLISGFFVESPGPLTLAELSGIVTVR